MPRRLSARLRLLAPPPGARRIEIGCGWSPRPGYVHVDIAPLHGNIDLVARGDEVPLPPHWADEILAVHMIEHLPPAALEATFRHWFDLLRPGGTLVLHTPNASAIGRVLDAAERSPHPGLWPAMSALYGYGHHPAEATDLRAFTAIGDHRIVFTPYTLATLLEFVGFEGVEDVSGQDPACHHARDWAPYIPGLCLEMRARTPDGHEGGD